MQVKVCPKCGVANAPSFPVCRRCQTSLAKVAAVDSTQVPQQQPSADQEQTQSYQQGPRNLDGTPVQPVGQTVQTGQTVRMGQPVQPGSPYGSPPSQPRYAPPDPDTPPPPQGMSALSIVGLIALVVAVFVGGYFIQRQATAPTPRPKGPADKVVTAFLQAKSTGVLKNVRPYLCKASLELLDKALSGPQAESAGFDRQEVHKMMLWGVEPTPEQLEGADVKVAVVTGKDDEKDTERVRANVVMKNDYRGPREGEFDYILVIEDKQWKIDLTRTAKAAFGRLAIPLGR